MHNTSSNIPIGFVENTILCQFSRFAIQICYKTTVKTILNLVRLVEKRISHEMHETKGSLLLMNGQVGVYTTSLQSHLIVLLLKDVTLCNLIFLSLPSQQWADFEQIMKLKLRTTMRQLVSIPRHILAFYIRFFFLHLVF